MDANESAVLLPQTEGDSSDGRMFIGNWEHVESETHNQRFGDKSCWRWILGLDESMDITTLNEQGVCAIGFHKRGDEESNVHEVSCGKTMFAHGSAYVCHWRSKSKASWTRMTQKERDDELPQSPSTHAVFCRMYKLQHDEGRYFLHEHCQSELPWRKDCSRTNSGR